MGKRFALVHPSPIPPPFVCVCVCVCVCVSVCARAPQAPKWSCLQPGCTAEGER